MLSCEQFEILMADALYLEEGQALPLDLKKHLDTCEVCRVEFAELHSAKLDVESAGLKHVVFDDIPERAALAELNSKLDLELDRIDAQHYRQIPQRTFSPWSMAVGAIAASLIIFVTGFVLLTSNQAVLPETVLSTDTNRELMDYLNKAQVMLMQVANTESAKDSTFPIQTTVARDMALEANILTEMDNSPFATGERKLLRDIEFMLLQIANLDESNMQDGVALLQRFLEENGILFRIRLLEMRDQNLVI